MSGNINPRARFYLSVAIDNLDGTIEIGADGYEGHQTLDAALKIISDAVDNIGGEYFVYECRPLRRIRRGKVKIKDVTEAAT